MKGSSDKLEKAWNLRLYVAGQTPKSIAALANLKKICQEHLADQYQIEAEVFSRAIRGKEKLEFGIDDAVLQARVIDAVFRSEKTGNWEKV